MPKINRDLDCSSSSKKLSLNLQNKRYTRRRYRAVPEIFRIRFEKLPAHDIPTGSSRIHTRNDARSIARAISQLFFGWSALCIILNPVGYSCRHDCPGDLRPRFVAGPVKIHPRTPLLTMAGVIRRASASWSTREQARHRRETIRNLSRGATSVCPRTSRNKVTTRPRADGRMLSQYHTRWAPLLYILLDSPQPSLIARDPRKFRLSRPHQGHSRVN